MDHVDMINGILAAEEKAKRMAEEAEQKKAHVKDGLEEQIAQMRAELKKKADETIAKLRGVSQQKLNEEMARLDGELEAALKKAEAMQQANHSQWAASLLARIVG